MNLMEIHKSSNLPLDIPVFPKLGAGTYLDDEVVLHNDLLPANSNLVMRMMIPNSFSISEVVVAFILVLESWWFVNLTIASK